MSLLKPFSKLPGLNTANILVSLINDSTLHWSDSSKHGNDVYFTIVTLNVGW